MINAIIIDDEQHCIDRLSSLLKDNFSSTVNLIDVFRSVEEGVKGIHKLQPDLVFLDIQINEKTGFDLLKEISDRNFEVVFTTAFNNFAVQAFRFSAIDYLLKPINVDDLREAVAKLKGKIDKEDASSKIDLLLDNIKAARVESKRIRIPVINGFVIVQVGDIIRCQSDINYTTLFLKDKGKLVVAKTLKEFEEMLAGYNFFRVHNSHLINLAYVKSYNRGKGGSVIMMDNTEIEVSTRRKDDFLKQMELV